MHALALDYLRGPAGPLQPPPASRPGQFSYSFTCADLAPGIPPYAGTSSATGSFASSRLCDSTKKSYMNKATPMTNSAPVATSMR